ncbi:MAG TPA: hypothetical protein VN238_10010 [Solirubrobacteraceae bacterium]|nr:hypothetical protein [Solirubrobacteraceae bacterium]
MESERAALWWVVRAIVVSVAVIAGSLVLMELVGDIAVLGLIAGFVLLLGVLYGLPLLAWLRDRRST